MKKRNIGVAIFIIIFGAFVYQVLALNTKAKTCNTSDWKISKPKDNTSTKTLTVGTDNDSLKFKVTVSGGLTATYELSKASPVVIDYSTVNNQTIVVTIEQIDAPNYCVGSYVKHTYDIGSPVETTEANTNYNGKCKAFRDSATTAEQSAFYQKYLPYCYQTTVESNFSSDDKDDETSILTKMINNVKTLWSNQEAIKKQTGNDLTPTAGYEEVKEDPSTKILSAKCSVNNKGENGEGACTNSNVKKYYHIKKTEHTANGQVACKTECKEELIVTFDPPQAVKAGLCFSYAVKVQSKLTCNATVYPNVAPVMGPVCKPYVHCNEVEGYETQSGPNEEYDSCVKACDGGKYTKSCSNKCYNKVYKNNTTNSKASNMLTYTNTVKATKTADACPSSAPNQKASWDTVFNFVQNNNTGRYYRTDDGVIHWETNKNYAGCRWAQYAEFYFSNAALAQRTVNDDNSDPQASTGYSPSIANDGNTQDFGFKVNNAGCSNVCVWLGCDNQEVDADKVADEYNKKLAEYNKAIQECSSEAKCPTTTQTSYFTISVDDQKWTAENTTGTGNKSGDTEIFQGNETNTKDGIGGECYGGTKNDTFDYYTRWTFPGSWINIKNHKIVYTKPSDINSYNGGEGKYCISPEKKNVNTDWWYAYHNANGQRCNISKDTKVEKYNIRASVGLDDTKDYTIKKNAGFGYFKWNVDMKCFYALVDTSISIPVCPEGMECNPKPCTGDNCEKTTSDNYEIKTAATDNLLPTSGDNKEITASKLLNSTKNSDSAVTKIADDDSETPYNWSVEATNVELNEYQVKPSATKDAIENLKDGVYSDDYLDYQFDLSPNNLKEIKSKYSSINYGTFKSDLKNSSDTIVKNNDGTTAFRVYYSSLVSKYAKTRPTGRGLKCNNLDSSTNCKTFNNAETTGWLASMGITE